MGSGPAQDVFSQLSDCVVACRSVGSAVAAQIGTKHLKIPQECGHLEIPEAVVRAQRMYENEERLVG